LWGPADVISSNRGIGNLHSEIPDADLSRPSVQDAWQRSRLSENFPKTESIGITGFENRGSWRREVRNISNREFARRDHDRPSVGTRGGDQRNRKSPERNAPSVNRRSGNRGVKRTRHQNSRNPDSRYPDKIWAVRSQEDLDR
jgi:hypothetical protein